MASVDDSYDVYCNFVTYAKNSIDCLVEVAGAKGERTIKSLLRDGADINAVEWIKGKSFTPLSHAIVKNKGKNIQVLLSYNADANKPNADGKTPLMFAVEMNSQKQIKWLLERGAELEKRDKSGKTALVYCIAKNHYKLAKYLLSKGACANTEDNMRKSVLMYAAQSNNLKLVKRLVMHGADPSSRDRDGYMAETYAGKSENICKYLMELTRSTKKQISAMSDGESERKSSLYEDVHDPIYANILSVSVASEPQSFNGRDVSNIPSPGPACNGSEQSQQNRRSTTFKKERLENDLYLTSTMISDDDVSPKTSASNEVDVNATNASGKSALHYAAMKTDPLLVNLLLKKGADTNVKDNEGNTPLILAAQEGATLVVKSLLDFPRVQASEEIPARFERLERQPDHQRNSYYRSVGTGTEDEPMTTGIRTQSVLPEKLLHSISEAIGDEQRALGTQLGFQLHEIDQFKKDEKNTKDATFRMLVKWNLKCSCQPSDHLMQLQDALRKLGRRDVIWDKLTEARDQREGSDVIDRSMNEGDNEDDIVDDYDIIYD